MMPATPPDGWHDGETPVTSRKTADKNIRAMSWDDLPRLAAMAAADPFGWGYDELSQAMIDDHAACVVAHDASGVIGSLVHGLADETKKSDRKANRVRLHSVVHQLVVDPGRASRVAREGSGPPAPGTPSRRRAGWGRRLMGSIARYALAIVPQACGGDTAATCRLVVTVPVPESAVAAQQFLAACGFRVPVDKDGKPAVEPSPYLQSDEDAYVFRMETDIDVKPAKRSA